MNSILPSELINNGTISESMLVMILMLPIIGTIIGIAKHIIGIKALGIYAPLILTYAYFQLGLSSMETKWTDQVFYGLKVGLILTIVVFLASLCTYTITKKIRMHYSPKVAFSLTTVAICLYFIVVIADATDKNTFLQGGFLPIILISSVSEQFISIMAQKSVKYAASLTITTILISSSIFLLVIYQPFQDLIIERPYLILITLVINFIVGRFKGLRVLEYWRFRDILNKEN